MIHINGEPPAVDVSNRTWEVTRIDDILESFIGGRGVATKLAHDRIPFKADPLGAENRVYFSTGPSRPHR